MRHGWIPLLCLFVSLGWGAPQSEEEAASFPIDLDTLLSKTAIYVGDVFEYRISVRHSNEFSFVTQEFEERLVVRPFELVEFQIEQKVVGEETLLDLVLSLVCYEPPGVMEIPSLNLFYYPSGSLSQAGIQQDIPARVLRVPSQRIQLQSILLGEGDRLRDPLRLIPFPRSNLILPVLSAGVLLLVVAGAIIVGVRYTRQKQDGQPDQLERLREETLHSLRQVQQKVPSEGQDRDPYLEVSKVVRRYLQYRYGFLSQALTPEEIREELQGSTDPEFASQVETVLELCDRLFFEGATSPAPNLEDLCSQAMNLVHSRSLESP